MFSLRKPSVTGRLGDQGAGAWHLLLKAGSDLLSLERIWDWEEKSGESKVAGEAITHDFRVISPVRRKYRREKHPFLRAALTHPAERRGESRVKRLKPSSTYSSSQVKIRARDGTGGAELLGL